MPGLDLPCKLVIKQSVIISIIPRSIQCSCVVTSPKFQGASFITSLVSLRPDQPYLGTSLSSLLMEVRNGNRNRCRGQRRSTVHVHSSDISYLTISITIPPNA